MYSVNQELLKQPFKQFQIGGALLFCVYNNPCDNSISINLLLYVLKIVLNILCVRLLVKMYC